MREFSLSGKVAIVTGAGRGIGEGIALTLAEAGAQIVAAARTQGEIEQTAARVRGLGRACLPVRTDVTCWPDVENLVDAALQEFGRIDILVSQAGRGGGRKPIVLLPDRRPAREEDPGDPPMPVTEELWHEVLDANLTSMFLCARAVGPHLIRQRKGKVIFMSSFVARKAHPNQAAYSTSKAGVDMLTRCLAVEWARYGVNVNAIGPGYVRTRMTEPIMKKDTARDRLLASVPLNRFAEPREVGLLAVYLASEASDYLTGQTIYLDGGLLA